MFSRDGVQGHDKNACVYVNQNKDGEFTDTQFIPLALIHAFSSQEYSPPPLLIFPKLGVVMCSD